MPLIKEHKKPPSVIDSDRGRYSCSRGKSRKKNTCIIPRPGGKEKEKMEFEILNEAHRIIAVKPELLPGCLFCYIPVLDVIVLDTAAQSRWACGADGGLSGVTRPDKERDEGIRCEG